MLFIVFNGIAFFILGIYSDAVTKVSIEPKIDINLSLPGGISLSEGNRNLVAKNEDPQNSGFFWQSSATENQAKDSVSLNRNIFD